MSARTWQIVRTDGDIDADLTGLAAVDEAPWWQRVAPVLRYV